MGRGQTFYWKSESEQKLRHAIISNEHDEECFMLTIWYGLTGIPILWSQWFEGA